MMSIGLISAGKEGTLLGSRYVAEDAERPQLLPFQ